jgi:hypothetical protein
MTDRLKLAEAYYAVASDLRRNAEWMLMTAVNLEKSADGMCEENIAEKVSSETTEKT